MTSANTRYMLVRIIKDWSFPDIFRQTPGGLGLWDGIRFTEEAIADCDAVIVLNKPAENISCNIRKGGSFILSQESPIPLYHWQTRSFRDFDHALTFWKNNEVVNAGANLVPAQTALPWHIGKSYDELLSISVNDIHPIKQNKISWITSNYRQKPGQVKRLAFLEFIQKNGLQFDLFGKGFQPIDDKYEAMHAYKYSIAIENYSCDDYWTEKISDCFLSFAMPLYHGATNITKYFPERAMILIDPDRPQYSLDKIRDAVSNDAWSANIEAICEARESILQRYQFFPWMSERIRKLGNEEKHPITIPANTKSQPLINPVDARAQLTVVICTRNRAPLLKYCLDGLLKQDCSASDYKLLVVDNNSTDNTQEVAKSYAGKLPVEVIVEKETGLSRARNAAVNHAATEWIAYLDDDAIPATDFVSRALRIVRTAGFDCFGGTYFPWYLTKKPDWLSADFGKRPLNAEKLSVLNKGYISGGISAWKTSLVKACGMFPVHLGMTGDKIAYGEETYLLNEVRERGFCVGYDPDWKMDHLVSPDKCTMKWHLKFHFAQGRDSVEIFKEKPAVSRKTILKRIILKELWKGFALLGKAMFKRGYYFQNFVIDTLRPTLYAYGQYTGLRNQSLNANSSGS
jgi:glycosyltransferase involved in cell wall biosynthesis